jgi:predicted methyltransferase
MDGILNTDTYYTMEGIMTSLGRGVVGLAGAAGKGYISQLEGKHISVGKQYAGHKIALAFTGITTDLEGLQL